MLNLLRRLVRLIKPTSTVVVVDSSVKYVPEAVFSKKGLIMVRKWKPVHKAPQFPCNHYLPIETMKDTNSSRYWAKVTCGNCLRSSLKKRYETIQKQSVKEQSTKKQVAHMLGKAMAESGHKQGFKKSFDPRYYSGGVTSST